MVMNRALILLHFCVHVQHRTLEAVLDRGERLDDLVGKSEELSLHSKAFYTTVRIQVFSQSPFVCVSICICVVKHKM